MEAISVYLTTSVVFFALLKLTLSSFALPYCDPDVQPASSPSGDLRLFNSAALNPQIPPFLDAKRMSHLQGSWLFELQAAAVACDGFTTGAAPKEAHAIFKRGL